MAISELTKLEMQIGFTLGSLVGMIAGDVFVVGFTNWQWYFKALSVIGAVGIAGNLVFAVSEMLKMRKGLLEVQKQIDEINRQAQSSSPGSNVSYMG